MRKTLHIEKSDERGYPRLAFAVPAGAERVDVRASYPESVPRGSGDFVLAEQRCVIDLALHSREQSAPGRQDAVDALYQRP